MNINKYIYILEYPKIRSRIVIPFLNYDSQGACSSPYPTSWVERGRKSQRGQGDRSLIWFVHLVVHPT